MIAQAQNQTVGKINKISSAFLLGQDKELVIEHNKELYHLRKAESYY